MDTVRSFLPALLSRLNPPQSLQSQRLPELRFLGFLAMVDLPIKRALESLGRSLLPLTVR